MQMQAVSLVRPAGQAVKVTGRPEGTTVRINGSQVNPAADGSFPVTAGAPSSLEIVRGDAVIMRSAVPALAANQVAEVAFSERVQYAPGSEDDRRNRAAKAKLAMSLAGIGALIGVGGALVKLSRRR